MATERARWSSSGSPYVTFYIDADVVSTEQAPAGAGYGRWLVAIYLRMTKGSSSNYGGAGTQYAIANGSVVGSHSANPFLPSGLTSWNHGPYYVWVNANSSGYWSGTSTTYPVAMQMDYGNVHTGWVNGSLTLNRLATAPGAPPAPVFSSASARSISFTIAQPSSTGGLPILDYTMQVATDSTFSTIVKQWVGTSSLQTAEDLDPLTSYAIRYFARNAAGNGPWSPIASMSTQAFSAPSITITPTITGAGATATLTPTGATTVDLYDIEYEYLSPPPIPTPAVQSGSTATNTMIVSGMRPGATYRWRARAHSGPFVTDWSGWVSATQPAPSTSAGDYFDGSTAPADEQTFSWAGTVNNSMSLASSASVFGWAVIANAAATTQLQRVRGGVSGSYAAMVTLITDATAAGLSVGIVNAADTAAAVQPGQSYFGSIHVMPSRSQRMAAGIYWLDGSATPAPIGAPAIGDGVVVAGSSDTWTRLVVGPVQAPPGAVYGIPFAVDVTGTGWSLWLGGDRLRTDAAMVTMGSLYPYFDGDTPDTEQYAYDWTGTPNWSTSIRTPLDSNLEDALVDPDCPPVPSAPAPPVIDSTCIEETGIWRRYWVSIPATEVSTWKTMVPTVELRTAGAAARQVRIRTYPNPFGYAPENLDLTDWCAEQIISFMPASTVFTLDGVFERAWAEVQGRAAIPADHLLYGTDGVPATWPALSCGIAYTVSLDVPLDAPESNLDISVSLTARG